MPYGRLVFHRPRIKLYFPVGIFKNACYNEGVPYRENFLMQGQIRSFMKHLFRSFALLLCILLLVYPFSVCRQTRGAESGLVAAFSPYYTTHASAQDEFGTEQYAEGKNGLLYYAVFRPDTGNDNIDAVLSRFLSGLITDFSARADAAGRSMQLDLDYLSATAGSFVGSVRFYGFSHTLGKPEEKAPVSYAFVFDRQTGLPLALNDIFTADGIETLKTMLCASLSATGQEVSPAALTDTVLQNALLLTGKETVFIFSADSLFTGSALIEANFSFEELAGTFTDPFERLAADLLPAALPSTQPDVSTQPDTSTQPDASTQPQTGSPKIALTFDDGPSKTVTPKLLALLERYGVHASFCIVGNRIAGKEDIVRAIVAGGNDIVNHTWEHINLMEVTPEEAKESLQKTNQTVYDLTGYTIRLVRPPYGHANQSVQQTCAELDLSLIRWSIDSEDWKSHDAQSIFDICSSQAADGYIILCHDLYDSTYEAMELLIPYLLEQGYDLVTLSELFESAGVTPVAGEVYRFIP